MKPLYYVIIALALAGCGKTSRTVAISNPSSTVVASNDVQKLVDDENSYRLGLGQTALTSGLSCTVQQVTSGNWLSTASTGYPGSGAIVLGGTSYAYLHSSAFNEESNSGAETLIPSAIRPLFTGLNYKISCTGQVVVTADGYYSFTMDSDDGSILTVDGTAIINNDGQHGMTLKSGTKFLRKGVKTFSLLYAQSGGGAHGLVIKMDGSVLPGANFFH